MTITLRGQKGSELTHQELDGNFTDLAGQISSLPDSAQVIGLIDSSYVQARQSFAAGADSADVAIVAQPMIDSSILATVNNAYVQARQDFQYSSLTGRPSNVSSFTNDEGYTTYDSDNTFGIIDSAYINARVSSIDSDKVIDLVDSSYVTARAPAGLDSAQVTAITTPLVGTGVMSDSTGVVLITSSTTLTKKGNGNVYVRLAGGGGGTTGSPGNNLKGGHSSGHGFLNNVQDGATITVTIGLGGGQQQNGGTTTVTDGTQTLSIPGGGGSASAQFSNNGVPRDNVTATGGATDLNPGRGRAAYSNGTGLLFIPGFGEGIVSTNVNITSGTDGAVMMWGV
tara:strand:+ start:6618 stop:7637 length:1020 start_codon:yes stop_codon:yes gene_type:complete